jgi:hypothetical protein
MSLFEAIDIQLIVAMIGFLAGFFLQRIRGTWAYFNARRFWRPLLRRDLALVLGDGFPDLRGFEASDMIGRGDLMASYELTTYFARMGFRRLSPVFADHMMGDDLSGRPLRRSLIVLGGPDANKVNLRCLKRMHLSYKPAILKSGDDANEPAARSTWELPTLIYVGSAEDGKTGVFEPSLEEGEKGKEVTRDYGVIIRAHNPFDSWSFKPFDPNRGKRMVIIYGCYGYGTLAAVLYSQTKEFLELVKNDDDDIECIVECQIIMGTPQAIGCVYFESQPHGSFSRHLDNTS